MLVKLKYYYKIKKLYRKLSKNDKFYLHLIKKSKKEKKDDNYIEDVKSDGFHFHYEIQQEIDSLETKYLLALARKLKLTIPDRNEEKMWEDNFYSINGKSLTSLGFSYLTTQIRNEKKERRLSSSFWISLLIGLLGALCSFLALLLQFR